MSDGPQFEPFNSILKGGQLPRNTISIFDKNRICFGKSCYEEYIKKASNRWIRLSYAEDKEYKYLGFQFYNKYQEGCYKATIQGKSARISPDSFFKHHNIGDLRGIHKVEEYQDKKLGKILMLKIKKVV